LVSSEWRENIRNLREKEGMTQKELARRIGEGVNDRMIGKWETGETKVIPIDYLVKIAKIFNVSIDELLTGVKSQNVVLSNDLHLSDAAIEELCSESSITSAINLLLNPKYCFGDIPLGHQLLMLIHNCIEQDSYCGEYSIGETADGHVMKSFVHASDINIFLIKDLMEKIKEMRRNESMEKAKEMRRNEKSKR